jgi:2-polyprenyl-6-methoxyphenol hydroxylase-like FAD-dependent oxidoreductase
MAEHHSDVLIVGAGPVGMTLALDLAARGVAVTLCETRADANPPSVKCNHVSARSMEIFRRLGLADRIRAAGLPPDYPHSVSYRTATTGREITRIPIAARAERFTPRDTGADAGWPTPEPPHRINQIYLEPILGAACADRPGIDLRYRCEVTGFRQDGDGVTATLRDLATGAETLARARYLIGCDGGRSATRKAIGAKLEGDAVIQRVQSSYIRAPGLIGAMQAPPAWAMFSMNPRRAGNVYAIDGRERWLVHNYLRPEEEGFDSVDRDACLRAILGVGEEFDYELLAREDWYGRRLVTDRMRAGWVFLCGDAAHLWVPYAGYGMNAGIADAANLAWMLAGHLAGWAPEAILDAHEAERLPITRQVSHFAMDHCMKMAGQRSAVPADIEADTPEAAARREAFAREVHDLNVTQYAASGLNFGYYYDASPIIAYDGAEAPAYGMGHFTSSTVPGCRVPHLWLAGGRSLYDVAGGDFALLRLDPEAETEPLERAAARAGLPLRVVTVDGDDPLRAAYTTRLLIARPDQHVGWRGDALPDDPGALVDLLRGAGGTP